LPTRSASDFWRAILPVYRRPVDDVIDIAARAVAGILADSVK
jgi:hypothetical protein